jgi:uncharacterized repeat protein (TIGR01451 family)
MKNKSFIWLKNKLNLVLNNIILIITARLILGSIFIFSGLTKILGDIDFIGVINGYNILPESLSTLYGLSLPWVELIIGSLLVLGLFTRLAAAIGSAMVISFIFANIYTMVVPCQATNSSCGCLGSLIILDHKSSLILDIVMLISGILLLFYPGKLSILGILQSFFHSGKDYKSQVRSFPVRVIIILLIMAILLQGLMGNIFTASVSSQAVFAAIASEKVGDSLANQLPETTLEKLLDDVSPGTLDATINLGLESGRPVFLFIYADWCGHCKKQKPIVDELEAEYGDKINFIRVNGDEQPEAKTKFGVTGYPTMLLITGEDQNGYVSQKFSGFKDEDTLRNSLDYVFENRSLPENSETSTSELIRDEYVPSTMTASSTGDFKYDGCCVLDFNYKDIINNECLGDSIGDYLEYTIDSVTACGSGEHDCTMMDITVLEERDQGCSATLNLIPQPVCKIMEDDTVVEKTEGGECRYHNYLCFSHEFLDLVEGTCTETIYQTFYVGNTPVQVCDIQETVVVDQSGLVRTNLVRNCTSFLWDPYDKCHECNDKDGWYPVSTDICELRNYFCYDWECGYVWHEQKDCDDGDPTTKDVCDKNEGCIHLSCAQLDCDDANLCTVDYCEEGSGCRHTEISCNDGDECTHDWCDPDTGCHHIPKAGCDHPDDNCAVSTQVILPQYLPEPQQETDVAILRLGDAEATGRIISNFGIAAAFLDIGFDPAVAHEYKVLVVPSGGLYGLDSLASFKSDLAQYVEGGGKLVVFSQQHGYEYGVLPGGEVGGFGWIEDESCQFSSVGVSTYHPVLSGQDTLTPDVNVDGFFTSYPENAKVLLNRTKNGMPAALLYDYGDGQVLAMTIYSDVAYKMGMASEEERNLVRDIISWATSQEEVHGYGPGKILDIDVEVQSHLPSDVESYAQYVLGDNVTLTMSLTNDSQNPSVLTIFSVTDPDSVTHDVRVPSIILPGATKNITFSYQTTVSSKPGFYAVKPSLMYVGPVTVTRPEDSGFRLSADVSALSEYSVDLTLRDPDGNTVQEETSSLNVPPGQTSLVHFSYDSPSVTGIWILEYEILDYNSQCVRSGVKKFAVSNYAESFGGWVYQGSEITFALTQEKLYYVVGSRAELTVHVWNSGDADRDIFCDYDYGEQTLTVPAGGSANFTYEIPVISDMFSRVDFYDDTSDEYLGRSHQGIWAINPRERVTVSMDKTQYGSGENVNVFLTLQNNQEDAHDVTVSVQILDPKSVGILQQDVVLTLPAISSEQRTLTFSLPPTAEYGTYTVLARALVADIWAGAASAYFNLVDSEVKIVFARPDQVYAARENLNFNLEAANISSGPWASTLNISIPDMAFTDTADFVLEPGQSDVRSYSLSLPPDITAGRHEVILILSINGMKQSYSFWIPEPKLALSLGATTCDAGENINVILTNSGGADTSANCTLRLYDPHQILLYDSNTPETVMAQQSLTLLIPVPAQAVIGEYKVLAQCNYLNTGNTVQTVKVVTINGLSASLTSEIDKKIYLDHEDISIQSAITNSGSTISDANLHLEISGERQESGDVTREWVKYYDDNGNDIRNTLTALAVDTAGNSYVTGSVNYNSSIGTIKYDADGNEVWVDRYNSPDGDGDYEADTDVIAVDAFGNVYVTGIRDPVWGSSDFVTVKYDENGNKLWEKIFSLKQDEPTDLVVDSEGNVYVTGLALYHECGNWWEGYCSYITTIKYDTNGNELWVKQYGQSVPGPLISSFPRPDIAVDGSGNVFVMGGGPFLNEEQHYQFTTIKYASNGDELWVIPYDNVNADDMSHCTGFIGLDALGNVYVSGFSQDETSDQGGYFTVSYDTDGNMRWDAFSLSDTHQLVAMDVSPSGEVYTAYANLSGEGYAIKYDVSGNLAWTRDFEGEPGAAKLDSTGNFIIGGSIHTNEGLILLIVNYDPDGNLLWTFSDQLAGRVAMGLWYTPLLLEIDTGGNIYVAGTVNETTYEPTLDHYRYFTAKYVPGTAQPDGPLWETDIPIDLASSTGDIILTGVNIPSALPGATGKLWLEAALYSVTGQPVASSVPYSFYIMKTDTFLTMETDKVVYKPNETVTISGMVQNNAAITDDYTLEITQDGTPIFSESFSLPPGASHPFTTTTSSAASFVLEATADGVSVEDSVSVVAPAVDVTVYAPDVVGLAPFNGAVLIQNTTNIGAQINVSFAGQTWDVFLPTGQSRLLETLLSISENTALTAMIAGDVEKTAVKQVTMGETAAVHVLPQSFVMEGPLDILFTVENTGLIDTGFDVTFTIGAQSESRTVFVTHGVSLSDTVSFDLTAGNYVLHYGSLFGDGYSDINVGIPELELTLPSNLTVLAGQETTWSFTVRNNGGAEGEATIYLMVPDWEETKVAWVMPGQEEAVNFTFTVPDDLEEKSYKAVYRFNGVQDEFSFFVQGAKILVDASLDKNLYSEGETAVLTLEITNDCVMALDLFARAQLNEHEEAQSFALPNTGDSQALQFNVPVSFNGAKLSYGIYMASGRSLHLNSLYVHERQDVINLYTDKQVYLTGEMVSVFVDTTQSGTLDITAPRYHAVETLTGNTILNFAVPELRSGTYYIDYTFNGVSSSYPFDVIGYSARIVGFNLEPAICVPGQNMTLQAVVELNRDVDGSFKIELYDSQYALLDEFETPASYVSGENLISIERGFPCDKSGTYMIMYSVYGNLSGQPSTRLAIGAEYLDAESNLLADLLVTKTDSPDPVTKDSNLTYTVVVRNNGPSESTGVNLIDTLPSGVTFVSVSTTQGSSTQAGSTITWEVGTLTNGSQATMTIVVTPIVTGTISNTATVDAAITDPDSSNNTASLSTTVAPESSGGNGGGGGDGGGSIPSADLSISKVDDPDPVIAGTTITYTISVNNTGPNVATSVKVTDALPDRATFISAGGDGWTLVREENVLTFTLLDSLSVGSAPDININVKAPATARIITNSATVSAEQIDPKQDNNTASASTEVEPVPSSTPVVVPAPTPPPSPTPSPVDIPSQTITPTPTHEISPAPAPASATEPAMPQPLNWWLIAGIIIAVVIIIFIILFILIRKRKWNGKPR